MSVRAMPIDKVRAGMQVSRAIYGASGETLLAAGITLTPRYIQRLQELGVLALYIHDEEVGDLEINDVVSEKTRLQALKITKEAMDNLKLSPALELSKVKSVVDDIIEELLSNKDVIVNLVDIRALNDYTFGHSVNVAILSLITGIAMGYEREKLCKLGTGALFHDIGNTLLPENVLKQDRPLTDEEENLYQQHTVLGFKVLRKLENFSLSAAHVALQHHERYNGSGYPRQLPKESINEFARIVAVTDLYDKLTSGWGGQPRCLPFQALELIIANREKFFHPDVVENFMNTVAVFPIGTLIMLNTQEKGVVVQTCKEHPTRPRVRVLADSGGKRIVPPYELDLALNPNCCIVRLLDEGN